MQELKEKHRHSEPAVPNTAKLSLPRQQQQQQQPDTTYNAATGSDSDDEWLDDEGDDPILDALRQRRLAELKQQQIKHAENVAKGHGELRTIAQDDFLPECTGTSEWVVVHFFHDEFQRCEILDHHLKLIAPRHKECKFLRTNANKTPFFVTKLNIRTLPTLMVFQHGKMVDRLTGFDKLAVDPQEPDKWRTSRLQQWLAQTGAIKYIPSKEELLAEEMEEMDLTKQRGKIYRGGYLRDLDTW